MSPKAIAAIVVIALFLTALLGFWLVERSRPVVPYSTAELPEPCRELGFEGVSYIVCEIDLRHADVGIHHSGPDGIAYGSLDAFDRAMVEQGRPVVLAMNAGMYHEGLSPVGLLVEDGRKVSPVDSGEGEGNFYLKPNGIFLIGGDGKAAMMETGEFVARRPGSRFATQSGPMLVIDGQVHPKFLPDGTSKFTRNGVGVRDPDTVVLAISLSEVSLGSFARLFRDELRCPNALFLDGAISTLSNGERTLLGGDYPVGPILSVTPKR
ncbi:phosphodiester glycosidase family protein [Mesorhizobium sp. LHD-90]|uniref:phosphodiester glycosidase family protein n=1 Tax=Mesorhizobium sp. LHD-90 TaxID=3071414 RepID=UPI0027E1DCD1|nr:phosphodiester glycosidase family protein [Mesorhizobium sp. LHD-90]MDQ6433107.1 phosphodiester glycosidase family protein [Mesorhizobium sp. LHD-90]